MAADNTPIYTRQTMVLAKAETTTGTAISLTGTEGAFIVQTGDDPVEEIIEMDERPKIASSAKYPAVPGSQMARISFEAELIGAATVPAMLSVFLPACGWTLSSRTFTQNPHASTLSTLTIAVLHATRWRKISGAMGTGVLTVRPGHFAKIRYTFTGKLEADADAAQVSPTFPSTKPPRWANASALTIASFAPLVRELTFDFGNDVQMRPSPVESCGYRSAYIPVANPMVTLDPEAQLVATRATQSLLLASTEEALSIIIGSVSDNIITIASTAAQTMKRNGGAGNGLVLDPIELALNALPTIVCS